MSLSLNNNLQTLKVGDYFWCNSYTIDTKFEQIVDETDYSSKEKYRWILSDLAVHTDYETEKRQINKDWSTNGDGYFKFIVVDIKNNGDIICIADRNIAYRIPWNFYDARGGLMQIGTSYHDLESVLYKNKCVGGTPIWSSCLNGDVDQYGGQKAFGVTAAKGTYWATGLCFGDTNFDKEWIGYQFKEPVSIQRVNIVFENRYWTEYYNLKKLYLEYSDDGNDWGLAKELDIKIGANDCNIWHVLNFNHEHPYKHQFWRMRFGTSNVNLTKESLKLNYIEMCETVTGKTNDKLKDFDPILTSITSNAKKDEGFIEYNEWDKYINSDLNGVMDKIGDNSVWNLKYPSFTNTPAHGVSVGVVIRGGGNGDAGAFGVVDARKKYENDVMTGVGFRPMLILKPKKRIDEKQYFFNVNGQYKTYNLGSEQVLEPAPLIDEFIEDGSTLTSTQHQIKVTATNGSSVWKLFNGTSDSWVSSDGETSVEITIDFGEGTEKTIGGYVMKYNFGKNTLPVANATVKQDIYPSPRDWNLYGSLKGDDWTLIEKRNGVYWKQNEEKVFIIGNDVKYRFFKFIFISNNSDIKNIAIQYLNLYPTKYKKINPYWKLLSTTMPSQKIIKSEGLSDLSKLDRKNKIDKIDTTFSNNLGSGSIYKCDLDLSTLQNMYKLKLK
ncbi:discoidin domain-containing protein [Paenibacillus sp. B1-33]|uniref:discoidin domain-containing protein n=1 Tax=unclassified Paenibacillus TaxID=185978 RepID=UPI003D2A2612